MMPSYLKSALALVDTLIFASTNSHLNNLQTSIIKEVWQGKKYLEIAENYGYTEGHIKDVASCLWKILSEELGERVTKSNFRTVLTRHLPSQTTLPILYPTKADTHLKQECDPSISASPFLRVPASVIPSNLKANGYETATFVGRETAIAHLDRLVNQGSKMIVIQGEGGIGKTTLAQQYLYNQEFELVLTLLMAKETQNIISVDSVIEEWLKRDLNEEAGREFGMTLGRLKRHLETRRIGILIDNLEPALDKNGKLIQSHRRYLELLRVLADWQVQSVTLITSRDRLCESDINVTHYRLAGLDRQAWQDYFSIYQIVPDEVSLQLIHKTYGGNAKAMGIISGIIREDFDGDINLYWQENDSDPLNKIDLKNLVSSQFNRLQMLDPDAYQLLCRLGGYRYQDIATVSQTGLLTLLWDRKTSHHKPIVESLKNRSLVEFYQGKYWLHPAIRAESVAQLKASGEWKTINQTIAEYWTASVRSIETLEDALIALEAYYHHLEIEEFEQAAKVLLTSRNNQWGQFLPLGSTLYRLGLIQPVFSAIAQIIDKVQAPSSLSELNNILGDLYWITGDIKSAISCQQTAIDISSKCLKALEASQENRKAIYYFKMLEIDSLLSIGLYKIDLWELQAATSLFSQVIEITENTAHYRWGQKAAICLALVNSYLGQTSKAAVLVEEFYDAIVAEQLEEYTGRFAYFIQLLGQTYVNLGDLDKALDLYRRAIAFSETSHYTQVKGKTLTGLAELYRKQEQWDLALSHHSEAIKILENIGAKCDLAEAYFQQGLTHQKMRNISHSKDNFDRALKLFSDMEASKQVEKVLLSRLTMRT
jgi:tetratricopeptide (TPR) repeat protein